MSPLKDLSRTAGALALATMATAAAWSADVPAAADFVLTNAKIYTAARPALAATLAVSRGRLVYVGDADGARPLIGPHTTVQDAHGRFVVPGLVDSHIHPLDIVDFDGCDLDSKGKSLRQISAFVRACIGRYRLPAGKWLAVHQWSPTSDNHPDADYPNLRVALDKAAPTNPVYLMGDDGHRGGFNSPALALARNSAGRVVGLSKATLAGDFAAYRLLVGVDAHGKPDGAVNEEARLLLETAHMNYLDLDAVLAHPEAIPQQLNKAGITAVLDAAVYPDGLAVYGKLLAGKHMTVRATLAQCFYPSRTRDAAGGVDYDGMVARARASDCS